MSEHHPRLSRLFAAMLRRPSGPIALVLVLTAIMLFFAQRLEVDYAIESAFPTFDRSRVEYEHYRKSFPLEDAHALLVFEAADLFTPAGLRRIAALEDEVGRLPGVVETQGLTTIKDIVDEGGLVKTERLFPRLDLDAAQLARRRHTATHDPLFAWNLAPPDGRATTIRVTLTEEHARKSLKRGEFVRQARVVLARHDALARAQGITQRLTLTGLPVGRSQYIEIINRDLGRLFPLAFLLIVVILYLSFRSAAEVLAAVFTILFSVVWSLGAMAIMQVPVQIMTQVTPIVVMIVSISDTVHIMADAREARRRGVSPRDAVVAAAAGGAIPCLLTEVTIAGGFVALVANDIRMIQEFGLATAAGVMLAWLANVTVLPLALSLLRRRARPERDMLPATTRALGRMVGSIAEVVSSHPRRIVAVAAAITAVSLLLALRVGRNYYIYDDVRPSSELARTARYLEQVHGGVSPFAIRIEPRDPKDRRPDAMLEPAALALLDRIGTRLERDHPDVVKNATSIAKYLRKAHRVLAGEAEAARAPLPTTRALAAQELMMIDDPAILRHLISFDRSTAVVTGDMPDVGIARASKLFAAIRAYLAQEEARTPYRIVATGTYGIFEGIYHSLVDGLLRSFGLALLLSFGIFCLVLRSWRLGLIALVPNVLPLVLTIGAMGLMLIDLKPSTVIVFSATLVIADDDTIQFLTRFRRAYLGLRATFADAHRRAALDTLRECGVPMFVTTCAISVGFVSLCFSEFLGLVYVGFLIAVSLLSAVFADLFLSPLLIIAFKPRLGGAPPVGPDGAKTRS